MATGIVETGKYNGYVFQNLKTDHGGIRFDANGYVVRCDYNEVGILSPTGVYTKLSSSSSLGTAYGGCDIDKRDGGILYPATLGHDVRKLACN